jgi:hypothetical protein
MKPDIRTLSNTTIALLGGNTVAGLALALQLRGAGYETVILMAPPTSLAEILLRDVDLLLVSPDLDHDRRREGLAALEGTGIGVRVPVLTLGPDVEDGLFAEQASDSSWPVEIGSLERAIVTTLGPGAQGGPATIASPAGETPPALAPARYPIR